MGKRPKRMVMIAAVFCILVMLFYICLNFLVSETETDFIYSLTVFIALLPSIAFMALVVFVERGDYVNG